MVQGKAYLCEPIRFIARSHYRLGCDHTRWTNRGREKIIHYGIYLLSADAKTPDTTIGYRLPGRQIIMSLQNEQLRGFIVSMGYGVIRAIRPILNGNGITNWIGHPRRAPGHGNHSQGWNQRYFGTARGKTRLLSSYEEPLSNNSNAN